MVVEDATRGSCGAIRGGRMSRLTSFLRLQVQRATRVLAPKVQAAHDVAPLYRLGFPVIVCWSAKAGCTTVLKWFLHHTGLLDEAVGQHEWLHDYRCQVLMAPLSAYVASCKSALRRGDAEVVKVVRDPARRAVSAYIHLIRHEYIPTWEPGVRAWKRRVGLTRQAGLTFEQFLHFVIDARSSGRAMDIHFQPQWQAAWDRFVDRVVPLERLTDEFAAIEDRHGLPRTDMGRFSVSYHHNAPDSGHRWPRDVARFAATHEDVAALGTPPVEAFLDAGTLELVRSAYADDYDAYGSFYAEPRRAVLHRAA